MSLNNKYLLLPLLLIPAQAGAQVLSIGGWYLTQSVQNLGRTVPLVAGRDGLLRVFVLASGANQAAPAVRVTITGGVPSPWVQTIPAPTASVPTALAEGSLQASWNLRVPGAVLAPGGTVTLELDPAHGGPTLQADLRVNLVKVFRTTLIPVIQQGLTGNVTSGGRTLASWVDYVQRMYPIGTVPGAVDVKAGAPYATQADCNAGSAGWSQLLREIEKKRVVEASTRHYYGAVNVSYSGGQSGIGYVGAPSAIGWDKASYNLTFTHEVGHNFGRHHAPCGVSTSDPDWPKDAAHANARIGLYGFDRAGGTLVAPTTADVMSYCKPRWVSDYTYSGIMAFRSASPIGAEAAPDAPQRCLLVSGSLRDGRMDLDPGFILNTRPVLPEGDAFLLEIQDRDGAALKRVPFTPGELARGDERQFTFAVPLQGIPEGAIGAMRVLSGRGVIAIRSGGLGGPPTPPSATATGPGRVHLTWNASEPTAMVRDPRTGEVLAFAEGGALDVLTDALYLDVSLSGGVASFDFKVPVALPK